MSHHIEIKFDHPANHGILRYLDGRKSMTKNVPSASPDSIPDPYYELGTHPDLVKRLWDELGGGLPADCRWVVHGTPVLAHPESGIVFAFAGGTHTYGMRLREPELGEAIRAGGKDVHQYSDGSTLDINEFGQEWVFGGWFDGEDRWCLAAYHFAGDTR